MSNNPESEFLASSGLLLGLSMRYVVRRSFAILQFFSLVSPYATYLSSVNLGAIAFKLQMIRLNLYPPAYAKKKKKSTVS